MPRFVLLRHECPPEYKPSHWDLMLELDGVLATWALSELPLAWTKAVESEKLEAPTMILVNQLADHRLAYLDYEGPVSGNRGEVKCCDRGELKILECSADRIRAELYGEILRCSLELVGSRNSGHWQMRVTPSNE